MAARRALAACVWLAATVVQIIVWLGQLLAAAGLYLWLRTCGGIVAFSTILLPGFLAIAWRLAFEPRTVIEHDIPYGQERRQYADVYLPQRGTGASLLKLMRARGVTARPAADDCEEERPLGAPPGSPVVLFFAGGGWTIGYKYWGAALALRLAARGVVVVCADYRQFPQTDAAGMIQDVGAALAWTKKHAARFGGDPERVVMVGQSAGAHLATQYVLGAARAALPGAAAGKPLADSVLRADPPLPCALVAVSGVFLLRSALMPFKRRGMTDSMIEGIFGGADARSLDALSPLCVLEGLASHASTAWRGQRLEAAASDPATDAVSGAAGSAPGPAGEGGPAPSGVLPVTPGASGTAAATAHDRPAADSTGSEGMRAEAGGGRGMYSPPLHQPLQPTLTPVAFPPLPDSAVATPAVASAATTPSGRESADWGEGLGLPATGEADPADGVSGLSAAKRSVLFVLLHGESDAVTDQADARLLHRELLRTGWRSVFGLYRGATHTSPIIEDAMRGHDYLLEDMTTICRHVSKRPESPALGPEVEHLSFGRREGVVVEGSVLAAAPGRPAFGGDVEVLPRLCPDSFIDRAKEWNPF